MVYPNIFLEVKMTAEKGLHLALVLCLFVLTPLANLEHFICTL